MVGTLGDMKARIADEMARDDLTSQIANAINDAIDAYSQERFDFNESRNITFNSVIGQEFYDQTTVPAFASVQQIDYLFVYITTVPTHLSPRAPWELEALSQAQFFQGQPLDFAWYGDQLRLYPTPSNVWMLRMGASIKVPAPATDAETANPWMAKAERLIRSRAKMELALHVVKDLDLAQTMSQAVQEALGQARDTSAMLRRIGHGRVRAHYL